MCSNPRFFGGLTGLAAVAIGHEEFVVEPGADEMVELVEVSDTTELNPVGLRMAALSDIAFSRWKESKNRN